MSRLSRLYQHALDINEGRKSACNHGIVPDVLYDKVIAQSTGISPTNFVRNFEYLIYKNNLEKILCLD